MIKQDEVIEEIRSSREAYARQFNYDLRAIGEDLRLRQGSSGHEVVQGAAKRLKIYKSEPLQAA